MIRDPSDGSVREARTQAPLAKPEPDFPVGQIATGLPMLSREQLDEASRLERSREWLKHYRSNRRTL